MVVAWLASGAFTDRNDLDGPVWGVLVVDVALFLIIAALSLVTRRTWTAAAAGFQLVNVLLHFAMLIDLRITVYAYRMGLGFWSLLAVTALLVGTLEVAAAERRRSLDGRLQLGAGG